MGSTKTEIHRCTRINGLEKIAVTMVKGSMINLEDVMAGDVTRWSENFTRCAEVMAQWFRQGKKMRPGEKFGNAEREYVFVWMKLLDSEPATKMKSRSVK